MLPSAQELGITIPRGSHAYQTCPECSSSRKKKTDKCLSVSVKDGHVIFFCNNCPYTGKATIGERDIVMTASFPETIQEPVHLIPVPTTGPVMSLSQKALTWFAGRGITQPTLENAKVVSKHGRYKGKEQDLIGFPYRIDGQTYAHKVRTFDKDFFQQGSCVTYWLDDQVLPGEDLIIVEGECFPGGVEVLTPTGWCRLDQYQGQMVVQALPSGELSMVTPLARIEKNFVGNLIKFKSKGCSITVTPGHNMVGISDSGWRKFPAKDGPYSKADLIPRSGMMDGKGISLTDDQIAFAIAISADASIRSLKGDPDQSPGWGSRPPKEKRYAVMGFKKSRKIERMRGLISRLKLQASDRPNAKGYTGICVSIPDWVPGRMLPWSWIEDATLEQREFILAELVEWDGNKVSNRTQTEYSSKHYDNSSWVQAMAHTSGRCSTIIERSNTYGEWFKTSILNGKKTSSWQAYSPSYIPHDGMVYCVQVPSGYLMVRHEGHISIVGNCDALSIREAGHQSVVSIPCGAVPKVKEGKIDPTESGKLSFVWGGKALYQAAGRIIIAMDTDAPGTATAEELARRIGKPRCWRILWPDGCKDANDVLVKHGAVELKKLIDNPEPWPIAGVHDAWQYVPTVKEMYRNGIGHGESTGYSNVDELYTVVRGNLTVITGVPGSGKTTWLNNVMVNLGKTLDWKFAVYSTELDPELHIATLATIYNQAPFFNGPTQRMTEAQLDVAIKWVADHFIFIGSDDSPNYEDIIDRFEVAVMRMGVVAVVTDPTGYIRRPDTGQADHEAIGTMLERFRGFGKSHDCAVFVVVHPTKMRAREDGTVPIPRGMDISGSVAWYARADSGLTIHRDPENRGVSQVISWKARFSHSGSEGKAELYFDPVTQTYSEQPFASIGPAVYNMSNGDPWSFSNED